MDVKWIKITTDMFSDEKIRVIEQMPEGTAILLMWIKLLTLAGRCNADGYVYISETIPYTDDMLAAIWNANFIIVKLALKTFEKFGMIEISMNNQIRIVNWEKHQNVAGLERIREQTKLRVARHREQKQLCNVTVTQCNATDIDIERDIDKEYVSVDKPQKKTIPPLIDDVKAYCKERNNNVDAEKWFDFYESKGWYVGKNKMKDWKAAVRTWERGSNEKKNDGYNAKPFEF